MTLGIFDGFGKKSFELVEITSLFDFVIFIENIFPKIFFGKVFPNFLIFSFGSDFVAEGVKFFCGF